MSLTGNLEIFPMPEVLRLLSRSKKTGCLTVDAVETEGRIYLAGGAITFANTRSDDVFRQALINSGLVTEDSLRSSGASLNEARRPRAVGHHRFRSRIRGGEPVSDSQARTRRVRIRR